MKNFELIDELKKYKPFDEKETEYLKTYIDFLENGENQFSRTNLERHIVADAFLFNESLDKILLTHHKALGFWLPFGGHSDGESNSLNVALREVIEESGITNIDTLDGKILDIDIHTIPNNPFKSEPEHKHYDVRFVFTTPEENFVVSDESDTLKWFDYKEFKALLRNSSYYSGTERILPKLDKFIEKQKNNLKTI